MTRFSIKCILSEIDQLGDLLGDEHYDKVRTLHRGIYNLEQEILVDQTERIEELEAQVSLLTHKVVTCGVAASHPDPAMTECYPSEWDSPQAQEVRKLRAERDRLEAQVAEARELLLHYACGYTRTSADLAEWLERTAPKGET